MPMADIVAVLSLKGGQGKTTIAAHYALYSNSHYYTNDYNSGTEALYKDKFPGGHFHIIKPQDEGFDLVSNKMVFDFGGFSDDRLPDVVSGADLCVVPISCFSSADIKSLFVTVDAVERLNQKILIIINNTATKDIEALMDGIQGVYHGTYPVKVVKRSSYMTYLVTEGKTPFELSEIGATRKALASIQDQLRDLFSFIGGY
jgi:hypothetical protein